MHTGVYTCSHARSHTPYAYRKCVVDTIMYIVHSLMCRKNNKIVLKICSTSCSAASLLNRTRLCPHSRRLLHWGADANAQTEQKDTPCHLAAYRGHTGVVRELLIGGTNVWLTNCRGLDVMGEAEANKQTAVQLFLRRCVSL